MSNSLKKPANDNYPRTRPDKATAQAAMESGYITVMDFVHMAERHGWDIQETRV